jgi:Uma2 family endonuclease
MNALPRRYFTPEEYLELELKAEYKSQYVAGEIFAMAGAEPAHIELTDNLTWIFRNLFEGRPCRTYSNELRVRVKPGDLWTYPDLTLVCGKPNFDLSAGRPTSLLNPQVIFEILSPSTEAFDRGDKFARYRLLDSLTDYVLVSADRMRIEHFVRQPNNQWLLTEYNKPEHCLPLASVDCELPLAKIYDRVNLSDPSFGG